MVGRVGALYQLQLLDKEIDEARKALGNLESQLGKNGGLPSARRKLAEEEGSLRALRAALRTLELDLDGLTSKMASTGEMLYAGEVTNPKELASLQQEMEYLQRRQSEVEDRALETMAEADETESRVRVEGERLQRLEQGWDAEQEQLSQQIEELRSRLASLEEARKGAVRSVHEGDLAVYEDLRRRKAGRAVALLEGGICQGCRVALPTSLVQKVRRGEDLVYCGSCQRILNFLS